MNEIKSCVAPVELMLLSQSCIPSWCQLQFSYGSGKIKRKFLINRWDINKISHFVGWN